MVKRDFTAGARGIPLQQDSAASSPLALLSRKALRAGCPRSISRNLLLFSLILLILAFTSCRQDMHDQAKYEPLEKTAFFGDARSSRPLIEGTVARGQLREDTRYYTGKEGDQFIENLPVEMSEKLLERGRDRYNIFCTPCHDRLGTGKGMVVRRGFRPPPSFHIERLRTASVGYYYDVITNGFGLMSSYAEQIPVEDRWAIVAYVRVLHLSQNATLEDVPPEDRAKLEAQN